MIDFQTNNNLATDLLKSYPINASRNELFLKHDKCINNYHRRRITDWTSHRHQQRLDGPGTEQNWN